MMRAKKELRLEREEWENDNGEKSVADGKFHHEKALPASTDGTTDVAPKPTTANGSHDSSTLNGEVDLEAGRHTAPNASMDTPVERSTQ